ncbi:MAG: DUF3047 domain-containing protein [Gammaproteobacteria bacterium]|nr:DUF3047 domain-containing protein [Gammaproteobacteria bacterium]
MPVTNITPPGWKPLLFGNIDRHTAYFLTRQNNKTVVQAVSHASASGYYLKTDISPQNQPFINWQWKINRILNKGDVTSKDGDDYPARLYISFDYDKSKLEGGERLKYNIYSLLYDTPPPLAVINYIWDNHTPINTIVNNAYSNRVKMIVVQSGKQNVGRWVAEKRNIIQDYIDAFGEVPGNISAIAIMTDTDNTGESATAWYGDIFFSVK